MSSWIPLHVHSQYSILDSTVSVKDLAKKASELNLPSLALTDFCNMYGAVDFFKGCEALNIKPILGCELMVAPTTRHEKKRIIGYAPGYSVIFLVKNLIGYKKLCKLSSKAFTEGFYYTPRIDKDLILEYHEGLICLIGNMHSTLGMLSQQNKTEEFEKEIAFFHQIFKEDLFLEIQRHHSSEEHLRQDGYYQEPWYLQLYQETIEAQKRLNSRLIEASKKLHIPLVATHDIHYIEREDWRAHEILMNVQSGETTEIVEKDAFGNPKSRMLNPKRQVKPSHEHYFKTPQDIQNLFSDLPEAIQNTQVIADRCQFSFNAKAKFYPVFIPPHLENKEYTNIEREKEAERFLRDLCEKNIEIRYTDEHLKKVKEKYPSQDPLEVVRNRLKYELEIIISKEMGDYLLIVYDFINWSKKQGIPVGPGRGSGAGSIILYLIGITDIEPLRFNLFFERFINPERISYPDIDVDICMERRSEVIEYTIHKYGRDKVAQIITFGTMKARMAIKDVGRVLNVPLAKVNNIAKLVPEDPNMTLEKALEIDPELRKLYEEDEEGRRILDLGIKLEGSIRNTGIHAAGLIICGDSLTDHIPICSAKDSDISVTQYSMKPVESVGMLKIDFLGLKTLTCIQKTVVAIKHSRGFVLDWVNLPLDDWKTFDLLNQGKTQGVFQLESSGMQELAKQLHIDKFEEIIAVGALYRPGPMEMIPSFINRKHGREKIEYDHPFLKDILDETYGIMVYQEQVMLIASRLANYSLAEGDLLRKAMGKKDKDEMTRQKEKFIQGSLKNQIDEDTASKLFDKIEKFASYGFNKSHATAYGFLSYVTAYLKANYTMEWLSALMTCDLDDLTKIAKHIRECQSMNIQILSPDINESRAEFAATPQGIRFALAAIKGIGKGVVDHIVEERDKGGPFSSLYKFVKRVDLKKVGKKVIETLIHAGCFDFIGWTRQALLLGFDPIYETVVREQSEMSKGWLDLFASDGQQEGQQFLIPPEVKVEIPRYELLKKEKELLGFFLTGHPMEEYKKILEDLECVNFHQLNGDDSSKIYKTAFIIESVDIKLSKTQRKFASLIISDGLERYELPVWPDLFEKTYPLLKENQMILSILQVEKEETLKLRVLWLDDLAHLDDQKMDEFKEKYVQVLQSAKTDKSRNKKNSEKQGPVTPEKQKELAEKKLKLLLTVKADQMRLSHIMMIKKLFVEYPGHISVEMEFLTDQKNKVGTVMIGADYGIRLDSSLEQYLKKLPFIESFKLSTSEN